VEGLDFFDAMPEPALLSAASGNGFANQMTNLHPTPVEDLPDSSSEPEFVSAIYRVDSADLEERSNAVKTLAQYHVQRSVNSLSKRASCDSEPSVRALAIASLGAINHESVFPAVLIGMADETREVRAAAARSLSRLSFDRADAYARVMETADEEMLQEIAKACIKAGIVGQNIDRLAACDRRQTQEAFALFSLMAKARMIDTILAAITDHPNKDVRVAAIHLLANSGQTEIYEQLRQLTESQTLSETLKTELLEAMYKLEHSHSKPEESAEAFLYTAESIPEAPSPEVSTIVEPVFAPGFEPQLEPNPDR
jgi:HEAT repeat protein